MSQKPFTNKNILSIKFDARIDEGLLVRDKEYTPLMSAPNANRIYQTVYFTPDVKLDNKLLNKFIGKETLSNEERQLIFLNNKTYTHFLSYISTNMSTNPGTNSIDDSIVKSNIEFILGIFFGHKALFYIGDKEYSIEQFIWDHKWNKSTPKSNIPTINVKIRLLLSEGRNSTFMKSVEVSCAQKWQTIIDDYSFLTGYTKDPTNQDEKDLWKKEHSFKEKDAPYSKQSVNQNVNLLRNNVRKLNNNTLLNSNLESSKVNAKSNIEIAKIQAATALKQQRMEELSREEQSKQNVIETARREALEATIRREKEDTRLKELQDQEVIRKENEEKQKIETDKREQREAIKEQREAIKEQRESIREQREVAREAAREAKEIKEAAKEAAKEATEKKEIALKKQYPNLRRSKRGNIKSIPHNVISFGGGNKTKKRRKSNHKRL